SINDSKVALSDGTRTKGHYKQTMVLACRPNSGGISKWEHGYFFEPFTQWATAYIQRQRNYQLDNDLQAEGDAVRSMLGKAGATFGRNFENANRDESFSPTCGRPTRMSSSNKQTM
ncbi:autotransporter outer membrane beta-barrel domain-containing protein, partial [Pseudomonas putida]